MISLRFKECIDRAGFAVYLFHKNDKNQTLAIAQPVHLVWEPLPGEGAVYYGDKEPTLSLDYESVYRDRVLDQIVTELERNGMRQSHEFEKGALEMAKAHIDDLRNIATKLASRT